MNTDPITLLRGDCKTDSLQKKVSQSMKLIESLYTGSEILAFSGGKDSIVLYDLVKRVVGNDIPIIHAVTTRDPAGTLSFIRNNYPDVMLDMPDTTFGELVRKKGFPSRMRRFCCEVLKERVGIGKRVFGGMRQSESIKRSAYEPEMCDERGFMKGTKHLLPIVSWTDDDVWTYIRGRGLPYTKYYDAPYCLKRHGCVACPLAYWKHRVAEYRIFPKWALADIRNIEVYMNTHPHTKLAEVCDNPEEAFFNWVWQGGYLEELKRSKMALFRLDAKEIINRELDLTL